LDLQTASCAGCHVLQLRSSSQIAEFFVKSTVKQTLAALAASDKSGRSKLNRVAARIEQMKGV
ncbi:MAG TPA: hypothetical protein VGV87_07325, partial [Blastocatellia bacterium]|nr:hypothetical protein [Blastocatellia bacterium]